MKIEFTRSVAMADVSPKPGDILDRPDSEARGLIDAGYAKPAGPAKPPKKATQTATKKGGETRSA